MKPLLHLMKKLCSQCEQFVRGGFYQNSSCGALASLAQNLNWYFATSPNSGFENLYLRVEMNLGFISRQKLLTSLMTSCSEASVMPENFSISLFQQFIFFSCLVARIIDAAATSLGMNLSREASSSWISCRYYAKKKTSSSLQATLNLLYLYKNL